MGTEASRAAVTSGEETAPTPAVGVEESGGFAGYAFAGVGPIPISTLDPAVGLIAEESDAGNTKGEENRPALA